MPGYALGSVAMPKEERTEFRHWYDAIIDAMLENPEAKMYEIAAQLNRSPSTISSIVNTDLFKARYNERRRELSDEIKERIGLRAAQTADKALEVLHKRLAETPERLPAAVVLDIASKTMGSIGFGVQAPPGAIQQTVNVTVSRDTIAQARERMRQIEGRASLEEQPAEQGRPEVVPSPLVKQEPGDE